MELFKLRKLISLTISRRTKLEKELLHFRLKMVKGSLFKRYIVCQKPGCRCSRGEKHGPFLYMNQIINGKLIQKYVGKNMRLVKKLNRYKDFQDKMREIRKLNRVIERLWIQFQEGLLEVEEAER